MFAQLYLLMPTASPPRLPCQRVPVPRGLVGTGRGLEPRQQQEAAGHGGTGRWSEPTAAPRVGVMHGACIGLQHLGEGVEAAAPSCRQSHLQRQRQRGNNTGGLMLLTDNSSVCYRRERGIVLAVIMVLAVKGKWQWHVLVSGCMRAGRGMKSLSFSWLMLRFSTVADAGHSQ